MSSKFLDYSGLSHLWDKIVAWTKRTLTNNVSYNTTSHTIQQTKCNGTNDAQTTTDIVSASTIVTDGGGITSHLIVDNKALTLTWGQTKTIATIGSTDITVKMPSNPNTDNCTDATNDTSNSLYLIGAVELISTTKTNSNENVKINVGTDYTSLDAPYFNGVGLTRSGRFGFSITGENSVILNVERSYTLGPACAKSVDTSISANSTSTNLPTSLAVENRIQASISGLVHLTGSETITGQKTFEGVDIILKNLTSSPSSPTPGIYFQNRANDDTYSDWKIYSQSGGSLSSDTLFFDRISSLNQYTVAELNDDYFTLNSYGMRFVYGTLGSNPYRLPITITIEQKYTENNYDYPLLYLLLDFDTFNTVVVDGVHTPNSSNAEFDNCVASKGYVDNIVGDIETLLASI